jgi:hypothetical protein
VIKVTDISGLFYYPDLRFNKHLDPEIIMWKEGVSKGNKYPEKQIKKASLSGRDAFNI